MDPPTAMVDGNALAVGAHGVLKANVLALFQQLLPAAFISGALLQAEVQEYSRVYGSLVVIWLMVWQRLQAAGTMKTAVLEVVRGLPASFWTQPCKRLRSVQEGGRILSSHTGAYNQARKDLSLPVVEQCCDRVFDQLMAASMAAQQERRAAFFLDGTSVRTPHTEQLVEKYPPTSNQHGPSHWPLIRMLVAHDLYTGLAMRPEWGPMHGEKAVSEQGLLESAIHRLPSQALIVGDSNFGVFSVAYTAAQQNHPVILRLTAVRARHMAGAVLRDGMDQRVVWKASRYDRMSHPQLPVDACVEGRLIVRQVEPGNGAEPFLLALFTTLPDAAEKVVKTYGYRWNIGVSSQGHIVQSVKDRPRSKDSDLVAGEAAWRESKTTEPSDKHTRKECAQRTRLQRTVNADVASLHESPVAETVDNARKQQGLAETSPKRQPSPAGYQRRHGVKDDVETGETLGARRRNLVEEMPAITVSGKCGHRRQGDGSGRSTGDGRAAKRAWREGPGPVSTPLTKMRQG
jgi:hypothetical protein